PADIIAKLKLPDKKGFRIRGKVDEVAFEKMTTYPVGEGRFIIALNGDLKKKLRKKEGTGVSLKFEKDDSGPFESADLLAALKEEPVASERFNSLALSHRNYFHRYVESAKTAPTRAGRIVSTIEAMLRGWDFGQMIRNSKKK